MRENELGRAHKRTNGRHGFLGVLILVPVANDKRVPLAERRVTRSLR